MNRKFLEQSRDDYIVCLCRENVRQAVRNCIEIMQSYVTNANLKIMKKLTQNSVPSVSYCLPTSMTLLFNFTRGMGQILVMGRLLKFPWGS